MSSSDSNKRSIDVIKIENMGKEEREAVESLLRDAQSLVVAIRNYIETLQFCDNHGIVVADRPNLEAVIRPNLAAGSGRDLERVPILLVRGQMAMESHIGLELKSELDKRLLIK